MVFLLIVASQVVSLVLGIVSRRQALGRGSAVASGILILLSSVVFAIDQARWSRPLPDLRFGLDGPELTDGGLRSCLRPDQVTPVNKALQESFRDYLNIEQRNMDQTTNEEGHLITVIRPLSNELPKTKKCDGTVPGEKAARSIAEGI